MLGFKYYTLAKAKGVGQRPRGSGLDLPRTEGCNHRSLASSSCQETFTGPKISIGQGPGVGEGVGEGHW